MASVYETYTYEEIKNLPDDQKVIALKELKSIYPDSKDLAQHWGVAFIAVSNMVGKYLEGKQVGRKKMTDEEKAQAKVEREAEKKLKAQQEKEQQGKQQESQQTQEQITNTDQVNKTEKSQVIQDTQFIQTKTNSNSFSINLEKNMNGEEAISRINGIANSLLKENQYRVSLVIEEIGEV